MALGAVQQITSAGLAPSYAAPLPTENIAPDDNLFLHVKNANAAPCVVAMVDPGRTPAGSTAQNQTVSVPATSGDRMIPLSEALRNPATGLIQVTFSVQTSVSAAVIRR